MHTQINRRRKHVRVWTKKGILTIDIWEKLRRWYPNYTIIVERGE